MKLKIKVISVVLISIITLLTLFFLLINPTLIEQYVEIEMELMEENIQRVENAIQSEEERLESIVRDYAVWDDTYEFIQTNNQRYIVSNWVDDTFITNKIDFVIYYDKKGNRVYDKGFNHVEGKYFNLYNIINPADLQRFHNRRETVFLKGGNESILLATYPTHLSSEEGLSNGTLIMGLLLSDDFVQRMENVVQLPIELTNSEDKPMHNNEITFQEENYVKGSIYIPYINSSSHGEFYFTIDRHIYSKGKESLRFFYTTYGLVSLLFIATILFFLDKQVLSKLSNISRDLRYIQETKDLKKRIKVNGKDEIAELETGINRMLHSLDESQNEIKLMALTDDLTGIPNRKYFMDKLRNLIEENQEVRLAVLFLDIDLFKRINDTLGHHIGDALLKEIVGRMKASLSKENILARWGGDEFVIILNNHDTIEVVGKCHKLLEKISNPIQIASMDFEITTSIGISEYPYDTNNAQKLIQNADIAMYEAKRAGKNHYVYYKDISELAYFKNNFILENDLRQAISNNELVLFYQPIINGENKKIIGVEALIRWEHPTKGLIPPSEFISLAEELGIMPKIGDWVLRDALKQVKEWHDAGHHNIFVSINVSKTQLINQKFIMEVNEQLQKYDFPPSLLHLEITESDVSTYFDKLIAFTSKLNDLGVKVSLDDFGTGLSSLMYLKELCVDQLKIDRIFIKDIPNHSFDLALLSGMIELCKKLNIEVVAEGVENLKQYHYLSKYSINIQGYFFSPPVRADECLLILSENITKQ
ncbi:EAL domain-containing protein [Evansella sp. AB-P1]|uniref:EAL domain-containing protein n=1 Tax=Evansella sp. AB-P1 TaxID=3037653 RepID=UPI0024200402|nr:EAL domain-containing protein [Evansella sp. AB-P1]MDG5788000.1 EAL domain-containing protein [Evansella sp. AB-P1]